MTFLVLKLGQDSENRATHLPPRISEVTPRISVRSNLCTQRELQRLLSILVRVQINTHLAPRDLVLFVKLCKEYIVQNSICHF